MKCIDCLRIQPPPKGMPHQGKCQDDHNGVTKSLRYERQCDKFIQMNDDQRTAKRDAWERVWNPPKRAKTTEGEEE